MSRNVLAAFAAVLFAFSAQARAQAPDPAPATVDAAQEAPAPPRALDAGDLSAYVDGVVEAAMRRDGIAGATVAVVDVHGPLLLRGYGIDRQRPRREVDPQRTMFRIASISKTFTYLLGLELVDRGLLDLDAPVNDYLPPGLRLPEDRWPPVEVRHLFTHTAGFEDSAMGHLFVDSPDAVLDPHEYLRRHRPARVRPPGVHAVYSNYSVALLGALVAHVAGTDFDTLVERELFGPMGMDSTTFREPLGRDDPRDAGGRFDGRWSQGFRRAGGGFKVQAFEHIAQVGPAGGASSTAADMGRYMRMLLRGGELDGVQVLSPAAFARLEAGPLFRNAPEVGGFSWGFFNARIGGVETLGHGGATSWFHSGMTVVPELGVGIFISTNTNTGRRLASSFAPMVLERYFERARSAVPEPPQGFEAGRFAGRYRVGRTNFSTAERAFLWATVDATAADDGSLVLAANGEATRWIPEGGLVFREAEGPGRIAFFEDDDGDIAGYANAAGHVVMERARWFDALPWLYRVLALAAAAAVLVLAGAWMRRGRRVRDQPSARRSALWLYLTAVAWLVVLGMLAVFFRGAQADQTGLFYGYPGGLFTAALWLVVPVMAMTAACVAMLGPAWKARDWGGWRKLRHTLAVASFALAAWMLWHWNLVGWKL